MARQTFVKLIDDISGGQADETVQFSYRGQSYEIDLSTKNAQAFHRDMAKYIDHSRKAGRVATATRGSRGSGATRDYDLVALRDWAIENGHPVPSRGRVKQTIIDAYKAAGGR